MQTAPSVERATVRVRMTNGELAELLETAVQATNAVALSHAGTAATLASHREHCDKDKAEIKTELKSINSKIWAGLVVLLLQFVGVAGYLVINGPPWINQAHAQSK